jgi:hypothetical protein
MADRILLKMNPASAMKISRENNPPPPNPKKGIRKGNPKPPPP